MKLYKAIIFDLDRTIWDFDKNSESEIRRLFHTFSLKDKGLIENLFVTYYTEVNEQLWDDFRNGKVSHDEIRSKRFNVILEKFGVIDVKLAFDLNAQYIKECPKNGSLFPGVATVLKIMVEAGYKLYIGSNGRQDIQEIKLKSTGVYDLFSGVYCSDLLRVTKPDPLFLKNILEDINLTKDECCYIGDDAMVDGEVARLVGMDFYLVNNGDLTVLNKFINDENN